MSLLIRQPVSSCPSTLGINPTVCGVVVSTWKLNEYVDGPLDQVKPGSCFQSSDEGPSLLFFVV